MGVEMLFILKSYCDSYSLVMQGSHKALLLPCIHQHAATLTLTQLPSPPPPVTSVSIQVAYGSATCLSYAYSHVSELQAPLYQL